MVNERNWKNWFRSVLPGGDGEEPNTGQLEIHEADEKPVVFDYATTSSGILHLDASEDAETPEDVGEVEEETPAAPASASPIRPLTIVMLVCGTHGDVQPFVVLGRRLQTFGHRVRVASHKEYRSFVHKHGLEFYPLGGNPKVLSEYIVNNPGLFPNSLSDARASTKEIRETILSTWDACTEPDPGAEPGEAAQGKEGGGENAAAPAPSPGQGVPFRAQAIIANPVVFGHMHCAEALQVPLHVLFTMPWTPTGDFPSPLTRVQGVRSKRVNRATYRVAAEVVFVGVVGAVNELRTKRLGLPGLLPGDSGATLLEHHRVPFSYCWSPAVCPRPRDWPSNVRVTGYLFLDAPMISSGGGGKAEPGAEGGDAGGGRPGTAVPSYTPPADLQAFLDSGPPPVYVGFGSLVVPEPARVSQAVVAAAEEMGVRVILHRGWAGLGDELDQSKFPNAFLLRDPVPHTWLFPLCSAVVHHGGAGTTAEGLRHGRPTLVVPFFGDQFFWGSRILELGAGPKPLPARKLNQRRFAKALGRLQGEQARRKASEIQRALATEDGPGAAADAFHSSLPPWGVIEEEVVEGVLVESRAKGLVGGIKEARKLSKVLSKKTAAAAAAGLGAPGRSAGPGAGEGAAAPPASGADEGGLLLPPSITSPSGGASSDASGGATPPPTPAAESLGVPVSAPAEPDLAPPRVRWRLSEPSMADALYESGGAVADLVRLPYRGARKDGATGLARGMAKSFSGLVTRPALGVSLTAKASQAHSKRLLEDTMKWEGIRSGAGTSSEDDEDPTTKGARRGGSSLGALCGSARAASSTVTSDDGPTQPSGISRISLARLMRRISMGGSRGTDKKC